MTPVKAKEQALTVFENVFVDVDTSFMHELRRFKPVDSLFYTASFAVFWKFRIPPNILRPKTFREAFRYYAAPFGVGTAHIHSWSL